MRNLFSTFLFLFAFSCFAQTDTSITVHEWGTFTSKYTGYGKPYENVHKVIDEPVPSFVYNANFDNPLGYWYSHKDYNEYIRKKVELLNVYIKMETPVLYFYSQKAVADLTVEVKFPNGSISEFYPMPVVKEDTNYIISKSNHEFVQAPTLSFINYNGFAKWKINILAVEDLSKPTHPDESVSNLWLAPRKTKANMIEANGEREKYIFYRGLGGFTNPIIPQYTKSGNIAIKNQMDESIPYILVYEKTVDGKRFVWGVNSLAGKYSNLFIKNRLEVSNEIWINYYRKSFVSELVKAGLYEDEAEAMLNTWDKSYFGKPGIKIFWIVPRSFTDNILPISFSRSIASLERVMVGRTEIDSFNILEYSQYVTEPPIKIANGEYIIFPNPSTSDLFIKSNKQSAERVKIEMIDYLGRVVKSCEMDIIPFSNCKIPFDNPLLKGIYNIKISGTTFEQFKVSIF